MRRSDWLLIVVLLSMAGCATVPYPSPEIVTQVVRVPETRYVLIPPKLTEPCPIAEPSAMTVGEAVRVARERKTALERCNAKLREIVAVQGTPVPSAAKAKK